MHATHQFFLTRRSLYLLVIDAQAGEKESNIHYWLKIIQSYGGDSPVLVVVNKCDGPTHDEEAVEFWALGLGEMVTVSAEHGLGFAELAEALVQRGLTVDGPTTQAEFLGALGLAERASRLISANTERANEIEMSIH